MKKMILFFTVMFCSIALSQSTTVDWGEYNFGSDFNLTEPVSFEGTSVSTATFIMTAKHIPSNTEVLSDVGFTYDATEKYYYYTIGASDTGDAYAGDALIATAGIHYEIDTVGSRTIITK